MKPAILLSILASNLAPVIGVIAFGWRLFDFILFYWAETIILAAVTLAANGIRIMRDTLFHERRHRVIGLIGHLSWAPLFASLYGFVSLLLIGLTAEPGIDSPLKGLRFATEAIRRPDFIGACALIAVRYLFSIVGPTLRGPPPRNVRAARDFGFVLARMVAIMVGVTVALGIGRRIPVPYLSLALVVLPKMGLEIVTAKKLH